MEPRSSMVWQGMSDWRGGNSARGPLRANRERGWIKHMGKKHLVVMGLTQRDWGCPVAGVPAPVE